jgi:hypothetical protein
MLSQSVAGLVARRANQGAEMPKTERTHCKFIVKEGPDGTPFLAIDFLGGLRDDILLLNEAHLHFNLRQPVSYEDAKAFAGELNAHIDSLSVMTGEY